MMRVLLLLALGLFAAPIRAENRAPAAECVAQIPCQLGDRSYHVKPPDDWDGVTPLPVMLHFHGWKRQGTLIVKHARISGATRRRGVLLLAPNGARKTWNFWSSQTDDVAFARAVLEDAAKRYPIDRSRIFVSGYSFGSAMAWRFVCEDGADIAALLAVSGTLNQNEKCRTAPKEVRHVHGLSDTVMDFPMGPDGDQTYPVALWRKALGCDTGQISGQWRATQRDLFTRWVWSDCDVAGARVTLDLHGRGHFIPRGWFAQQLDELLSPAS